MNNENYEGVILNAYPDSLSQNLSGMVSFLSRKDTAGLFSTVYLLPSLFHWDMDRGFSIIDYNLDEAVAKREDLDRIEQLGMKLMLDIVMNHMSINSEQFHELQVNGKESKYRDFFIDWNKFWAGCGTMTKEGYIQPDQKYLDPMFFRKPGLPLMMVEMWGDDDELVPYWNTFYHGVKYEALSVENIREICGNDVDAVKIHEEFSKAIREGEPFDALCPELPEKTREILIGLTESCGDSVGQMDLNIKSEMVWKFYADVLKQLAGYGASIIRLDAFAYTSKVPGKRNFLNEPETWDILTRIQKLADQDHLSLLPEIHEAYSKGMYRKLSEQGYTAYDFFLPGLIIYTLENKNATVLKNWAEELNRDHINTVNMLGCHDGIPLLDLKGMISDDEIQNLIDTIVGRGGFVKNLHGKTNMYYQVNATYYSALGCDDRKMIAARAIQMFMPGTPLIWYLDLFAGKNDYEAMKLAGKDGHKEINRTNLNQEDIDTAMEKAVVKDQMTLIRFRNEYQAFKKGRTDSIEAAGDVLTMQSTNHGYWAMLKLDLSTMSVTVFRKDPNDTEWMTVYSD
ncbi:MAG: alpha-amylase family glycosyl hydrolase [Solobacterium sp.]|jgi:sucrose phosphorylase|nr:alpha-amylase family glycosyl hydrolase [Solobacterium sp.]